MEKMEMHDYGVIGNNVRSKCIVNHLPKIILLTNNDKLIS